MRTVHILVEGPTEEAFIKEILRPHLITFQIDIIPKTLETKRILNGPNIKGGNEYAKIKTQTQILLRNPNALLVTTFFDFYGLRDDFPGKRTLPAGSAEVRVAHLEKSFATDIGDNRFLPYLALHEFEALLFADTQKIVEKFPATRQMIVNELLAIRQKFKSPEEINEGQETAPSKRILRLFPSYQKPTDGLRITKAIGLDRIRSECSHFNQWLEKLEGLGKN